MADVYSPEKRSSIMRAVRSTGTGPEKTVRRLLLGLHLHFRSQVRDLPGTPDLVLSDRHVVVFVHGCFWHGHANCRRALLPTTRRGFWTRKVASNQRRDRAAARRLRGHGYRVLTIWTCQLQDASKVTRRILAAVKSPLLKARAPA